MNNTSSSPVSPALTQVSEAFLDYLQEWMAALPVYTAAQAMPDPEKAAILSVDLTQGFCKQGALASPRVGAIVAPVVRLFELSFARGVRHFVLPQDTHEPDAVEFSAWPAHCVRGTLEAEAVDEIKQLPFYSQMVTLPKNSINSAANSGLNGWIAAHPEVDTYLVVGDCTDLCVYQLAMQLRTEANAAQIQRRVIVPAECVDTYDLPVEAARAAGILPHPADLLHPLFLYHMALNGVEVVKAIRG